MFVPLLSAEDGYGVTYGGQFAVAGSVASTSRVVFPLTWGADKRAAAEYQKEVGGRLAPKLRAGGLMERRTNPYFRSDADRASVYARGEWRVRGPVFAATTVARQRSTLLGRTDRTTSIGADVTLDTRIDPLLPTNAIYARATFAHLIFPGQAINRIEVDARGYIGVYRGSVLCLRLVREDVSRPAPPFFKSLLGGSDTLRGFRAGSFIGDTLM